MELPLKPVVVLTESPKFRIEFEVTDDHGVARPVGVIDEDVNFGVLLDAMEVLGVPLKSLVIDLGHVERLNSSGIREWLLLLEKLQPPLHVTLSNVNQLMIEQASIIPGVLGPAEWTIDSFQAPYFCQTCKSDHSVSMQPSQVKFPDGHPKPPGFTCPKCSNPLQFDWLEEEYFAFLKRKKRAEHL
jgi:hypothetical protein